MTKALISILIIVVVAFGGWKLFQYWEQVDNDKEAKQKEAAAAVVDPNQLAGLPSQLQSSLQTAQQQGPDALGNWLKAYGRFVQDPRKAWIELDYVVMITRDNPQEARRIFAEVKERTPPASPVWPRIHDLEKSYQ